MSTFATARARACKHTASTLVGQQKCRFSASRFLSNSLPNRSPRACHIYLRMRLRNCLAPDDNAGIFGTASGRHLGVTIGASVGATLLKAASLKTGCGNCTTVISEAENKHRNRSCASSPVDKRRGTALPTSGSSSTYVASSVVDGASGNDRRGVAAGGGPPAPMPALLGARGTAAGRSGKSSSSLSLKCKSKTAFSMEGMSKLKDLPGGSPPK